MEKPNDNDKIVHMVVPKSEMMPMVVEGIVELGANPREVTTIKAWAPGKPPGGKLPENAKPQNRVKKSE